MNKVDTIKQQIVDFIKSDNGNVAEISFTERSAFKFWSKEDRYKVNIKTYNPSKGISFLLTTNGGKNKEEALNNAFHYIMNKHFVNSYTVKWAKNPEHVTHISYFYCSDLYEVLDKFYNENNSKAFTIFNIKLNPIS
jgi:hypothetical protein